MGSPETPTDEQYATLERAGQLQTLEGAPSLSRGDKGAKVSFTLPRQGVSLIVVTW